LQELVEQMEHAGVSDRMLIAFGLPLTPAFRHDVVVVRPTRIEGDALSVREALEAGVPVVASDVVERPLGTVTFLVDDAADLGHTLRRILDGPGTGNEPDRPAQEAADPPFLAPLIRIYRQQMALSSSEHSSGSR
jgi:glycosyltransferase involved in cell wall biosynthesis